jgi:hypothetical protein
MNFDCSQTKVFNWLNAASAERILAICKFHGAKVSRLAQERRALGVVKVRAVWNAPRLMDNAEACKRAIDACNAEGLIDSLTWQNS